MRTKLACAASALGVALALGSGPANAQSGEITIWSWNIAASSLKATVAGFNKQFPDVKVTVEDLGNQQVFDKTLAGCAAGGKSCEDPPGYRENAFGKLYLAYIRDPDGNKLCGLYRPQQ